MHSISLGLANLSDELLGIGGHLFLSLFSQVFRHIRVIQVLQNILHFGQLLALGHCVFVVHRLLLEVQVVAELVHLVLSVERQCQCIL